MALQRAIGNAAMTELLRSVQRESVQPEHMHGAGCEHDDPAGQLAAVERGLGSPARALDGATLAKKEQQFQADLSGVRVHTGPAAATAAAAVQASAFTVHQDIVFGSGQPSPEVLDHELTHVVRNQQSPAVGHDRGGGLSMTSPGDDSEREATSNAAGMRSGGQSRVLGPG